jgi:hypothetical protein
MYRFGRPVEKEGLGLVALDEGDDVVPVVVGQPLSLAGLVLAKVFRSFFLGWFLRDLRKSNLEGALSFGAYVPFSDLPGDVSIFTHELGEGGAVFGNGKTAGHSVLAEALAILAHHQSAAAWATRRVGDVGSGEADSFTGQTVDMWCGYIFAVIASDVPITQVVNVDENYIWLFGCV